ncbi:MAG: hypothetical protein FJ090_07390 [Deltaproteobacteria bacterium]|nr:hypothetical protein [Deltaproteobacteria bacterium]
MISLLLACSVEDQLSSAVGSDVAATDSMTEVAFVLGLKQGERDARVVELNAEHEVIRSIEMSAVIGERWGSQMPPPLLMDVQPLEGHRYLVAVQQLGLYEFDRDGNILWQHEDPTVGHDVDRLANGNTLYARPWAAQGEVAVVEVNPAGEEVWTWRGETFETNPEWDGYIDEGGAWLHVNSVQRLEDGTTSICVRNLNTVVVARANGEVARNISFASAPDSPGPVTEGNLLGHRPHGAEWVPNRGFHVALRGPDRAVGIANGKLAYQYREPNFTSISDVDALENGETLLVAHGSVRHVDAAGELIWDWTEPLEVLPAMDGAEDIRPRTRQAFYNITKVAADGSPLDYD